MCSGAPGHWREVNRVVKVALKEVSLIRGTDYGLVFVEVCECAGCCYFYLLHYLKVIGGPNLVSSYGTSC